MRRLAPEHGGLHRLFVASLAAKAAFAAVETLGGVGLLLTPSARVLAVIDWLAARDLIEDAAGPVAGRVLAAMHGVTPGTQHFYALYLLSHGLAKLVMVAFLARRITAAYPVSLTIMAGFIVYQMHRWTVTHGPALLALTAFDLLVMWLIWREWQAAAPD